MRKPDFIDYLLLTIIAAGTVFIAVMLAQPVPCTESLDITPGKNFNQPILTKHNCSPGQIPIDVKGDE